MTPRRMLAVALIVLGTLALVYKSFALPGERRSAKIGSLELALEKKKEIAVPAWLGVVAVVVGGALLLAPGRR